MPPPVPWKILKFVSTIKVSFFSKPQPFCKPDRPEILLDGTFNQKTVTTFETKSDDGTKSVWTLVKKEGDGGLRMFSKFIH